MTKPLRPWRKSPPIGRTNRSGGEECSSRGGKCACGRRKKSSRHEKCSSRSEKCSSRKVKCSSRRDKCPSEPEKWGIFRRDLRVRSSRGDFFRGENGGFL